MKTWTHKRAMLALAVLLFGPMLAAMALPPPRPVRLPPRVRIPITAGTEPGRTSDPCEFPAVTKPAEVRKATVEAEPNPWPSPIVAFVLRFAWTFLAACTGYYYGRRHRRHELLGLQCDLHYARKLSVSLAEYIERLKANYPTGADGLYQEEGT